MKNNKIGRDLCEEDVNEGSQCPFCGRDYKGKTTGSIYIHRRPNVVCNDCWNKYDPCEQTKLKIEGYSQAEVLTIKEEEYESKD